jgi:hypothetical protein
MPFTYYSSPLHDRAVVISDPHFPMHTACFETDLTQTCVHTRTCARTAPARTRSLHVRPARAPARAPNRRMQAQHACAHAHAHTQRRRTRTTRSQITLTHSMHTHTHTHAHTTLSYTQRRYTPTSRGAGALPIALIALIARALHQRTHCVAQPIINQSFIK